MDKLIANIRRIGIPVSKTDIYISIALIAAAVISIPVWYFIFAEKSPGRVIPLEIVNYTLVSPTTDISVTEGETITFLIKSDHDNEFHIEGYHAFRKVWANRKVELTFHALTPGRFPFVLERPNPATGQKSPLGYINILPK